MVSCTVFLCGLGFGGSDSLPEAHLSFVHQAREATTFTTLRTSATRYFRLCHFVSRNDDPASPSPDLTPSLCPSLWALFKGFRAYVCRWHPSQEASWQTATAGTLCSKCLALQASVRPPSSCLLPSRRWTPVVF